MSAHDRDLWDILADGGCSRQVIAVNGQGTPGLSLGSEFRKLDVDVGGTVGVKTFPTEGKIVIYTDQR